VREGGEEGEFAVAVDDLRGASLTLGPGEVPGGERRAKVGPGVHEPASAVHGVAATPRGRVLTGVEVLDLGSIREEKRRRRAPGLRCGIRQEWRLDWDRTTAISQGS
jgi:hypothetical protein